MAAEEHVTPGDEAFASLVARRFGTRAPPPEACPDANLLAAARNGGLMAEERELLEEHLRRCGTCRGTLAAIVQASEAESEKAGRPAPARPRPQPVHWRWAVSAAAAALILATLAWQGPALLRWLGGGPDAGPGRMDALLFASARDLAASHPDLFEGFAPLEAEELAVRAPDLRGPLDPVLGGGYALLEPAGRILDTRPAFRWVPLAGEADQEFEIELVTAGAAGETLWRASCGPSPFLYPAQEEALGNGAKYHWKLIPAGAPDGSAFVRGFEVVTAEEAEDFARAAGAIEARAEPAVRALVRAHYALRLGLVGEAEKAARAHVAVAPGDPVGRATLGLALRLLGSPEAGAYEESAPVREP